MKYTETNRILIADLETAIGYVDDAYKIVRKSGPMHSIECKLIAIGACVERSLKAQRRSVRASRK